MANPEHLDILKQGVRTWNEWRKGNPDIKPSLESADLSKTDLRQAILTGAHLWKVVMSEANAESANFQHAFLWEANLRDAHLKGSIFRNANLSLAILERAHL